MNDMLVGLKRMHHLPRRYMKARKAEGRTSRLEYIYRQSRERFEARDDAFKDDFEVIAQGEIGSVENVSFYGGLDGWKHE